MKGNSVNTAYLYTADFFNDVFSIGPVSVGGQNIFLDKLGPSDGVVEELLVRQLETYKNLGRKVAYQNGILVERVRMGTAQGSRMVPVPVLGTYTTRELRAHVEQLYNRK